MRIAIIGASGQLGRALRSELEGDLCALGHADIEIADPRSVREAIAGTRPDVVINAAAYNFVDRAEEEPAVAQAVNADGPRNLARICAERGIVLVHISTDYVFSGWEPGPGGVQPRSVPYRETDRPDPQNVYARSKLAGEEFVRAEAPRHFVLRTCGLFGETRERGKGNFVETMLRLGRERGEVRVVNDQECTPTSAADLARAIRKILATEAYGLYHATNAGSTTWEDFAKEIFRQAGVEVRVTPISTAEFSAKAVRPRYSVLDTSKLAAQVGATLPPWQAALAEYLAARKQSG
jgi:dTDP-4-dehydrorhamnose reductase